MNNQRSDAGRAPSNVVPLPPTTLEVITPEADQEAVVGLVLKHPELYVELRQIITPDDFSYIFWRDAWRACDDLYADGVLVDLNEVARALDPLIDDPVGVRLRLASAIGASGNKANVRLIAERVHRGATKALIYKALVESRNLVLDPSTNPFIDSVIEETLRNIHNAIEGRHGRDDSLMDVLVKINEEIEFALDHPGEVVTSYATGFPKFDSVTNGIPVGEVTVMMGYTGHGKTTLSTQIALNNAKAGRKVVLFTREQTREEVINKLISFESGIPYDVIRFKKVNRGQYREFVTASGKVAEYLHNFKILDRQDLQNGMTPALVRLKVDELLAKGDRPLVVLDGLWLMSPDKSLKSNDSNWWMELQQITWELTQVASRVGKEVPILILHQTNENPMARIHKKGAFNPRESDADGGKKSMFNVQNLWGLVNPRFMGVKDSKSGEAYLYVTKSRAGVQKNHREKFYFYKERYAEG